MFTIPTRLSQLFWQSHYSNIFWSTIPTQYYSDRTVWGGCSKLRHYSNMFTIPTFSSILFWQIIISTIPRTIPWTPKCGNLPCVAASYCARSAPKKFDYIGAHLLFRHWFLILFLRSHYSYIFCTTIPTEYYSDGRAKRAHEKCGTISTSILFWHSVHDYSDKWTIRTFFSPLFWQFCTVYYSNNC